MTEREIIQCIDDSANVYVRLFGMANHMMTVDTGRYSYVKPKDGEQGISFVFDVRIENLPVEHQQRLISEIKALQMPVWFPLLSSDETFRMFFGREKAHSQTVFGEDDEIYLALQHSEQRPTHLPAECRIEEISSAEKFAVWTGIVNDVLADGRQDLHPIHHYPLCQDGRLKCYVAYSGPVPAAAAATVRCGESASLELVATLPKMRRQGYARSICAKAAADAFRDGASLVTVRAANRAAASVYQSIGFKAYNSAI